MEGSRVPSLGRSSYYRNMVGRRQSLGNDTYCWRLHRLCLCDGWYSGYMEGFRSDTGMIFIHLLSYAYHRLLRRLLKRPGRYQTAAFERHHKAMRFHAREMGWDHAK